MDYITVIFRVEEIEEIIELLEQVAGCKSIDIAEKLAEKWKRYFDSFLSRWKKNNKEGS